MIGLLAFGIYSYRNDPNVRIATNDSVATLVQHVEQLLGNKAKEPLAGDFNTNSKEQKTSLKQEEGQNNGRHWNKAEATVYLNIQNNPVLHSAAIDAINAWNRTDAFTFKMNNNKKSAQIIISVEDNSGTSAAGETSTTYNPVTGHLLRANVQLNRFYLQNQWYGYSNERIVNTVEHELGHAIGLNHTNGVSVMYPKGSFYTIQPRDIQAVKKLYSEK